MLMFHRFFVFVLFFGYPLSTVSQEWIRTNQLGYQCKAVKVAVWVSKGESKIPSSFEIRDALTIETIWKSKNVKAYGSYGPFETTARMDFSNFEKLGAYYIQAGEIRSPNFSISDDVYEGTADFILNYMRQQRSGYNPFLKDSCHTHDGFIIDHPTLDSTHINVSGGWHDATDYLQYVPTSANAVFQMLFAYQQNPHAFGDKYNTSGLPVANGIPDILDEARWGLEWLCKMNPSKELMFNQLADDRDHKGFRLPTKDTVSYGKGLERPVYFCTGKPQGLLKFKNRTTGIASTAGKFSSAFALGAIVFNNIDSSFSQKLKIKSKEAFEHGLAHPGACQTAPCTSPYFYEEDNWVDDMELAAFQLYSLFGDTSYLAQAVSFGNQEPVTPWMGSDTAAHYQWYPFVNLGHYYLANSKKPSSEQFLRFLKDGIERIYQRGKSNAFLFGIPFIWCSNNLVSAALTQLRLYNSITGDKTYLEMEASLRDWLFGCNPWGTSMIIGLPEEGVHPRNPHSSLAFLYGYKLTGGLIDGPVYGSIFGRLLGLHLFKEDALKGFQSSLAVYHDDYGDYSTNEPTMDGTASLSYYLSSLEPKQKVIDRTVKSHGGIIRMDTTKKEIYLVFTAHDRADGGSVIRSVLKKHSIKASFFFTGDFYRNNEFKRLILDLKKDNHYLGAHSNKHLLYAPWDNRDSLLVTKQQFTDDIRENYKTISSFGIHKKNALFFMPPYEWYNRTISNWCDELGLTLVNNTPGTYSGGDWTYPELGDGYFSSDTIYTRIFRCEASNRNGLNGHILLIHLGSDDRRRDKFYNRLNQLIIDLKKNSYSFKRF